MYIITYKRPSSQHGSRCQNEVRGKSTRIFTDAAAAQQFAKSVTVLAIRDSAGRKINF